MGLGKRSHQFGWKNGFSVFLRILFRISTQGASRVSNPAQRAGWAATSTDESQRHCDADGNGPGCLPSEVRWSAEFGVRRNSLLAFRRPNQKQEIPDESPPVISSFKAAESTLVTLEFFGVSERARYTEPSPLSGSAEIKMITRYGKILFAVTMVSSLEAEEISRSMDSIRGAVSKAIPSIEKGMSGSADRRKCFTCHNQAVPLIALSEAKDRGFKINAANFKRQLKHTADHLTRGRKNYLAGRGQGGKVITAGYALWALEAGGYAPDETTAAVTAFLLAYQTESDRWSHPGKRPPSSGSDFTATYVALRGLDAFANAEQQEQTKSRRDAVARWLLSKSPAETEDQVFRLRSLRFMDDSEEAIRLATVELIKSQNSDGGWSQKAEMPSDSYATGTVLAALLRGGHSLKDDSVRRGAEYLVNTQLDDGTWHVRTRAKPFQTYYESGFPHGEDQFISIAASSWATLALTLCLPESRILVGRRSPVLKSGGSMA